MKNNFKKNGNMRVRYETDEERREILRILEEQRGFRIDEEEKRPRDTSREIIRTLDFNLKFKTINSTIPPFIYVPISSINVFLCYTALILLSFYDIHIRKKVYEFEYMKCEAYILTIYRVVQEYCWLILLEWKDAQ